MRFIYDGHANEGGIYRITNQINGRFYIGSTCQFKVRWATHRRELLKGNHCNAFLQNDFNKCGADAFVVEVLEVIPDRDSRLWAEGALIRQHFGKGCYNLEPEVGPHYPVNSRPRKPHTEATKEKIRQAKRGKRLPPEVEAQRVDAVRASMAKLKTTGGTRDWGASKRGVPRTEEAKCGSPLSSADRMGHWFCPQSRGITFVRSTSAKSTVRVAKRQRRNCGRPGSIVPG